MKRVSWKDLKKGDIVKVSGKQKNDRFIGKIRIDLTVYNLANEAVIEILIDYTNKYSDKNINKICLLNSDRIYKLTKEEVFLELEL